MDNDQIKHMVNRFLMWKLPEHFRPDCGIIYTPIRIADGRLLEPSGTNLLDATQAEAMVRHMIEGLPAARPASGEREGEESELSEKDLAMIDWAWETHKAAAPAPSPPSQASEIERLTREKDLAWKSQADMAELYIEAARKETAQRLRADAAEARVKELEEWQKRENETQERLQAIGEQFGAFGGEPRTDAMRRLLTEANARNGELRDALIDATAHLAAATSSYKRFCRKGVTGDALFSTKLSDYEKAEARARAVLRKEGK